MKTTQSRFMSDLSTMFLTPIILWHFSITHKMINMVTLILLFYYFFWKKPHVSVQPQNPEKIISYHFVKLEKFTWKGKSVGAKQIMTQDFFWEVQLVQSLWDKIIRDIVLHLLPVFCEKDKNSGVGRSVGMGAYEWKAQRKKLYIYCLGLCRNIPKFLFLDFISSLYTTGKKKSLLKWKVISKK